jgi:hypothetical protein
MILEFLGIIMIDFNQFPPYIYLAQVIEHCALSASTYLQLWREKDKDNVVHIYKKDVYVQFLKRPYKFKNDLINLVKEGLISIDETPKKYVIELVDYEIDAAGYPLC